MESNLPIAPSAEVITPTPLIIRGHHLANLYTYYYLNKGSTDAGIIADHAQKFVQELLNTPKSQAYVRDVLGSTPEQNQRFAKQYEEVIKRFMTLPDNYPLELVEDIPDDICAGCAIGKHCRELGDITTPDRGFIDMLLKYTDPEKSAITMQTEMAYFSNAAPKEVRRFKTEAGSIRTAFDNMIASSVQ